jgi:predicted esterase
MASQAAQAAGWHAGQPVLATGQPLKEAEAAMVLLHGRGGGARDIMALAGHWAKPGFAFLAPEAAGNTWYPYSFLAPLDRNEPELSSALSAVGGVLEQVEAAGVPLERTIVLGFSQGACLALEFAARNARRYGGVVGLSGGLVGPDGTPRTYPGSLAGTPVFLGCSDIDPHIPKERVTESARVLQDLGAAVTARIYPNLGHIVNQDEINFVRSLMDSVARA